MDDKINIFLKEKKIIISESYIEKKLSKDLNDLNCNVCGRKNYFKCSKCKSVYYCSKECQKIDWKCHKKSCELVNEEYCMKKDKKDFVFKSKVFTFIAHMIIENFKSKTCQIWCKKQDKDNLVFEEYKDYYKNKSFFENDDDIEGIDLSKCKLIIYDFDECIIHKYGEFY